MLVVVGSNQDQTYRDLAVIYATPMGRQIIDALHASHRTYRIGGGASDVLNSRYNPFFRKATYYQGTSDNIDGTFFRSFESLGHELYHAYMHHHNRNKGLSVLAQEREPIMFENYLRYIYDEGAGPQRLSYTGRKMFDPWSVTSFDTGGKKIDIKSVKLTTVYNYGLGKVSQESEDDGDNIAPRDNTRVVNPLDDIVKRILEYMDENGLKKIEVEF